MRVLLTGATGFIGQALVSEMRRRTWDVRALVRDTRSPAARWLVEQGASLVRGDVVQRVGLREAMTGMDAVVHNAGVYEFGADAATRERMHAVNVRGTDNVLGAALEAEVARTVYVSTVWALGPSGRAGEPVVMRDETRVHGPTCRTAYERSKLEAHRVALDYRARGLPLVVAMPNGVVGANDHSIFGYFLRAYLLRAMPPIAWEADAVYSLVDVHALASGISLAVEKAAMGEDYVFCGEPTSIGDLFVRWSRQTGHVAPRLVLPRWLMRPQMAMLEPLQRAFGLPAILSRDVVDASGVHLAYTSAKAQRDLGWTHPSSEEMWDRIYIRERDLVGSRTGFLDRLRHQPVG